MDCEATRGQLIDYLYDELSPEAWVRVEQHLGGCMGCQEELAALLEVAAMLDQWQAPEPSGGLVERIMARIRAAAVDAPSLADRERLPPAMPLVALALGGMAATASLGVTAHLMPQQGPSLTLAALGILWAVLYGGMFLVALGSWSRLTHLARVALEAGGLVILLAPVVSIPQVVEACSTWLGAAKGSIALNSMLFVVGGLYTALPLLVAHLVTGGARPAMFPRQGLASGLLYLLLIAPLFYLQCTALALGVGATWMAGGILGVFAAAPAGLWLVGRRVAASA